ncbi:MAG: hypothetical protein ISN26_02075 [Betaproteobacteria bacterium AqS2]|uniref:Tetratricopeptide repeat protein n=1 Tax=Candidatus Amphirhobacter heronislandensis TaxID=1732024 RepID=A0A930UFS7_9GAMM|nr:hypothetical protein [Betaproteobacteria bacterium AqS2]
MSSKNLNLTALAAFVCLLLAALAAPVRAQDDLTADETSVEANKRTIAQLNKVLDERPNYAWGYYTRALAHYNLGDDQAAKVDFLLANQLDSNLKIPEKYLEEIGQESEGDGVVGRLMSLFERLGGSN